jgi:hypothetical protein
MRSRVRRHSLARGNNITDLIPSTCLAGKPAAINVACVRRPMLPERPSINLRRSFSGSCAPTLRDAWVAPDRTHHCHGVSGSNAPNKWLENKIKYCLLWNSSKLTSGRRTETPRNQSRRSNMLSHPGKLLFVVYGRRRQNILSPGKIDPATHQARTDCRGSQRCGQGFWVRRLSPSDCDRNADCRQTCSSTSMLCRARDGVPE